MDEIILKLFEAFDEGNVSPAEKAALKTAEPIVEQVRERLTLREFDQFWSAAINVGTADVEASFARGFCPGVLPGGPGDAGGSSVIPERLPCGTERLPRWGSRQPQAD